MPVRWEEPNGVLVVFCLTVHRFEATALVSESASAIAKLCPL